MTRFLAACLVGQCALLGGPAIAGTQHPQDATIPAAQTQASPTDGALIAPLLPDGVLLKRALGRVAVSGVAGHTGVPQFVLWHAGGEESDQGLLLMPCALTRDLVALQQREGEDRLIQVSGLVTAYRGRNWLLPAAASLGSLASEQPDPGPAIPPGGRRIAGASAPSNATPAVTTPTEVVAVSPETIADQLDALLDEAGAPAPRSADPGRATVAAPDPRATERGVPESPDGVGVSAAGTAIAIARPVRVQDRRVTLTRDERGGAWRAVFSAASGGLPSSAELLPCARLDQMERSARGSPAGTPFLISGVLTEGESGRWFVLPTMVRPLRAGKWLFP